MQNQETQIENTSLNLLCLVLSGAYEELKNENKESRVLAIESRIEILKGLIEEAKELKGVKLLNKNHYLGYLKEQASQRYDYLKNWQILELAEELAIKKEIGLFECSGIYMELYPEYDN